jgi:hypothetical protein
VTGRFATFRIVLGCAAILASAAATFGPWSAIATAAALAGAFLFIRRSFARNAEEWAARDTEHEVSARAARLGIQGAITVSSEGVRLDGLCPPDPISTISWNDVLDIRTQRGLIPDATTVTLLVRARVLDVTRTTVVLTSNRHTALTEAIRRFRPEAAHT